MTFMIWAMGTGIMLALFSIAAALRDIAQGMPCLHENSRSEVEPRSGGSPVGEADAHVLIE